MRSLFVLISIFLFVAACSEDSVTNNSLSQDTSTDLKDLGSGDAEHRDIADDTKVVADVHGADSASDLVSDSAVVEDVRTDADTADPFEGRPTGQCQKNSDCPDQAGATCGPIPGGACLNCAGDDANCPSGTTCSAFGACIAECINEEDCAPGLRCLSNNRCGAKRCVQGVCPDAQFGCTESDVCQRKDCSSDATLCDNGTVCVEGRCALDR